MRIKDIISSKVIIDESEYKPRDRRLVEVTEELPPPPSGQEDLNFEVVVFNYLLSNKSDLGISNVYRLRAASADGLLRLDGGEMVLLQGKVRIVQNVGLIL